MIFAQLSYKHYLFLLFLLAIVSLSACGSAMPATSVAKLKVIANPTTTSVYINDTFVGTSRVLALKPVGMKPGVKFITFTADGYFPHDLRVDLPAGTTSISINLRPIPP
jgi:hypothetical protein